MSNASFVIAHDDPCLDGHFPGNPLVPGVVILESVIALVCERGGANTADIERCKFLQPLLPGQTCHIQLGEIIERRLRFTCLNDIGQTLASGRLLLRCADHVER